MTNRTPKARKTVVAFDCDGTLLTDEGQPNYPVIDLLRACQRCGCIVVAWSGGGIEYARHVVEDRLGLADVQIWDKVGGGTPDVAVDDTELCKLGLAQIIVRVQED